MKHHPVLSKYYNSLLLILMLAQTNLKDNLGKAIVHSGFQTHTYVMDNFMALLHIHAYFMEKMPVVIYSM